MSIELDILHVLSNLEDYKRFHGYVNKEYLTDETQGILKAYDEWFNTYNRDITDFNAFYVWLITLSKIKLSAKSRELYRLVCDKLNHYSTSESELEVIAKLKCMEAGDKLTTLADDLATRGSQDTLHDMKQIVDEAYDNVVDMGKEDAHFAKESIADILTGYYAAGGFDWPYEPFNVILGPLRPGDMGMVFARPEVGKTSFVLDICAAFAKQMTDPNATILFVNNEEDKRKIKLRACQVVLKSTPSDLIKMSDADTEFTKALGGDRLRIYHKEDATTKGIEQVCEALKPSIIVFNVLDKVVGFEKNNSETERLRQIAKWARGIATKYNAVVLCIGQADASAEGQRYLEQNQVYNSKTGIPGECDFLIGMGASHDPAEAKLRFFHVCKNKLPGGPKTDPSQNHGYATLEFKNETGNFRTSSV